jgi:hypothetical protein
MGTQANATEVQIASELYTALEMLHVDPDLLTIVGTWKSTGRDDEVLALLQSYNDIEKARRGGSA